MSYGPGGSRLLTATLVGAGAWVLGWLATAVLFVGVFGVLDPGQVALTAVFYPLLVVWFVLLLVVPAGSTPPALVAGVASSALLVAGGAVAVVRVGRVEVPWDAVKAGGGIALGHALVTVLAFSTFDASVYDSRPAFRTFALAFGGFVVPAAFGAVGGVFQWRFGGE